MGESTHPFVQAIAKARRRARYRGTPEPRAPRVVFFTGAGLSAESGVPTFRGAGGIYEGLDADRVLSGANLRANPDQVNRLLDEMRRRIESAEPNAAHRGIADVAREVPGTVVATQNVDDLLERAGVPDVLHLHGSLRRLRCAGRGHTVEIGYQRDPDTRCPECQSWLRADVVLFGEPAPLYKTMRDVFTSAREEDLLVVIGTQGNVIPISAIAGLLPGRKLLVNLHESADIDESHFARVLRASAGAAWPEVRQWIGASLTASD